MAVRYQNCLQIAATSDASNIGRMFSKWLFEWTTQVVGFTALDTSVSAWTDTTATGTHGASVTGDTARFSTSGDAYSFSSSDRDCYLTITGMTPASRNGIYRIIREIDANTVLLDVKHSVHEDGIPTGLSGLSWRLWGGAITTAPTAADWSVIRGTYSNSNTFDILITVGASGTSNLSMPTFTLGPYGTWNATANAWDDARNTTAIAKQRSFISAFPGTTMADNFRVFAYGNTDAVSIFYFLEDDAVRFFGWIYLGELTPRSFTVDTNPGVIIHYLINVSTSWTDLTWPPSSLAGYGVAQSPLIKWLGVDDATTISGDLLWRLHPQVANAVGLSTRHREDNRTNKFYRREILTRASTASHLEYRGILKNAWSCSEYLNPMMLLGTSGEYLHIYEGWIIPWNGSRIYWCE